MIHTPKITGFRSLSRSLPPYFRARGWCPLPQGLCCRTHEGGGDWSYRDKPSGRAEERLRGLSVWLRLQPSLPVAFLETTWTSLVPLPDPCLPAVIPNPGTSCLARRCPCPGVSEGNIGVLPSTQSFGYPRSVGR